MIVEKAVNMAKLMDVPVLGLVENFSYVQCPDCGKRISVFGESHVEEVAEHYGIPVLGQLPSLQPPVIKACWSSSRAIGSITQPTSSKR